MAAFQMDLVVVGGKIFPNAMHGMVGAQLNNFPLPLQFLLLPVCQEVIFHAVLFPVSGWAGGVRDKRILGKGFF